MHAMWIIGGLIILLGTISMNKGKSNYTGCSGEYYVAYALSLRQYLVAITNGNVPNVDIIVSSLESSNYLSLQVKTSRNAHRNNRYGREVWEWDVGSSAIGVQNNNFWYAFVDLKIDDNFESIPDIFFIPSLWVASYVKPEHSRKMYLLPADAKKYTLNRFDLIDNFLKNGSESNEFINKIPIEAKWNN